MNIPRLRPNMVFPGKSRKCSRCARRLGVPGGKETYPSIAMYDAVCWPCWHRYAVEMLRLARKQTPVLRRAAIIGGLVVIGMLALMIVASKVSR